MRTAGLALSQGRPRMPRRPADYNRMLQRSIRVTKAEELELLRVAQGTDEVRARAAETRLLNAHCRFVYGVTIQFAYPGHDLFDDLYSAACAGFLEGVRRYDKFEEKLALISYAVWWVRRYLVKTKYENTVSFGGVSNGYQRLKVLQAKADAYIEDGEEVPDDLLRNLREVRAAVSGRMTSIDQRNDSGDLVREFEDTGALLNIKRDIDALSTNAKMLAQLTRTLPERERFTLLTYYGVGLEGVEMTLDELGAAVSAKFHPGQKAISRERVRQIVLRAKRKLQKRADLLGYTRLSFQAEGNL